MSTRIQLAGELPTLRALGVEEAEELFRPGGNPDQRGAVLEGDPGGRSIVRFPLPGTPDAGGRPTGRPGQLGTGWVVLSRWCRASLGELVRSRFTAPRSASLAEREWNLYCHLLGHGVGVPRPLAVGARGRGLFSRDSFLVTRELGGFEPLKEWAGRERDPERRRRAAVALGLLLANVVRAGVLLPRLSVEDLGVKPEPRDDVGGFCDANLPSVPGRLKIRHLPGMAILGVRGGLLRKTLGPKEVHAMLSHLLEDARSKGLVDPGEARRIAALTVRGGSDRRRLWQALQ